MREAIDTAVRFSADHPMIALSLLVFGGIPLLLGWMHEARIIADCSVPLIRHVKQECREWRATIERVRKELRSSDEEEVSLTRKIDPTRGREIRPRATPHMR